MTQLTAINEYKLHPNVAKALMVLSIVSAILILASDMLGVPFALKLLCYSVSVMCVCIALLPHIKIWERKSL